MSCVVMDTDIVKRRVSEGVDVVDIVDITEMRETG